MDERTDLRTPDEGDPRITAMLREIYAPPVDSGYWNALEGRISARIAEHRGSIPVIPVNWWTDLAAWAGPGLAAAALIFAAAGVVLSRETDEDLRTTYEEVTDPVATDALPGAVQVVVAPHDGSSQREATFRYVLSH